MKKNINLFLIIITICFLSSNLFSQVKITEIPNYKIPSFESSFLTQTRLRNVIDFTEDWNIYLPGEESRKTKIDLPATFKGTDEIIYEKEFNLTDNQLSENRLRVKFLGLNYSAEISINGLMIYKNPGGEIPFNIELPHDVLKSDSINVLSVKINHDLDSETTLPLKQTAFLPLNLGGIFRDVFLEFLPNTAITYFSVRENVNEDFSDVVFNCKVRVNREKFITSIEDSIKTLTANLKLVSPDSIVVDKKSNIQLKMNSENKYSFSVELKDNEPKFWNPAKPDKYKLVAELLKGEKIIDEITKQIPLHKITKDEEKVKLNGNNFDIKGVTYYSNTKKYGNLISYEQLNNDLKIIKEAGFNTVRFAKTVPHPYALKLCYDLGLMAFIEIPLNSVPEYLAEKSNFKERVNGYLKYFLNRYSEMGCYSGVCIASGLLSNSKLHASFVDELAVIAKEISDKPIYASFIGFPKVKVNNLDFYGIERSNYDINKLKKEYEENINKFNKSDIIYSSLTYSTFRGGTSGYDNKNSVEAQAKYFNDFIDFANKNEIGTFFLNSMFDYQGHFPAYSSGYNEDNIYYHGIVGEDRNINRIAYKVIHGKLQKSQKVTIPMGEKADDSPILFVVIGLFTAILMGILINSKRKFREDATRAFLRPYNFFADIRDQRILSSFHSNFLMVILSSSFALLIANLLFYLRTNYLVERILVSFGLHTPVDLSAYLAWNPINAFLYLFLISFGLVILLSLVIYVGSFFVKNKVLFSNIYSMVIWSLLPFTLLLPIDLVLYRILNENLINIYIYGFLILFTLWHVQRLIKGIYVIFDVRAISVYFYGFLVFLVFSGGVLLYFQITNNTIYYLINSVKQFMLM